MKDKEPVYAQLLKEESSHLKVLKDTVEVNSRHLNAGIPSRHLIRLRALDLDKLIMLAAQYLAAILPQHLFALFSNKDELIRFWKGREIRVDDWVSLGRVVLTEIYGDPFMVPLEETDLNCAFKLKVEELTISNYLKGIISTEIEDPLDAHSVTYQRLSNTVEVESPRQYVNNMAMYIRHGELIDYRGICECHLKMRLPFLGKAGDPLVSHIWSQLGNSSRRQVMRKVNAKSLVGSSKSIEC